jgi:aryl-alcohol dehydrogenase-like predicted oxidoreductase
MQIILGTAQFSGNYGVLKNNLSKKIDQQYLKSIYSFSMKNKINLIDTAGSYHKVHKRIGASKLNKLNIISKIHVDKVYDEKKIKLQINQMFKDLKIKSIYAILIHNPENLNKNNIYKIINFLAKLKLKKKVVKVGLSIYEKKDLKFVKNIWIPDIVQLPINILNRNLSKDGTLRYLQNKNIEIHARSVFLQGLLLSEKVPRQFLRFKNIFDKWNKITKNNKEKKIYYCLMLINRIYKIKKFIIGFNDLNNLEAIINILKIKKKLPKNLVNFYSINKKLIDPRTWNK